MALVEANEENVEDGDKTCCLRSNRKERRDRSGRTFVGIGRPLMERHRRHLEGKADEHERDSQRDDGLRGNVGTKFRPDVNKQRRTRDSKNQRHAVKQNRRSENAHEVVLQTRFIALLITLPPCRQHVGRDGDEFEGNKDADEITS